MRPVAEDALRRALVAPPGPARFAEGAGPEGLRPAAVLCPVAPRADGLHVILTLRPATMRAHAGQIAFPGGKIDATDPTPLAAALREAEEEIGLPRTMPEVLGALPAYGTRTGFLIHPFVALLPESFAARPCATEVDEAFETPLDFLMDRTRHQRLTRMDRGVERAYWAMPWRDRFIWGATAGILRMLAERLEATAAEAEADAAAAG